MQPLLGYGPVRAVTSDLSQAPWALRLLYHQAETFIQVWAERLHSRSADIEGETELRGCGGGNEASSCRELFGCCGKLVRLSENVTRLWPPASSHRCLGFVV
jgi:hypothetical protein